MSFNFFQNIFYKNNLSKFTLGALLSQIDTNDRLHFIAIYLKKILTIQINYKIYYKKVFIVYLFYK